MKGSVCLFTCASVTKTTHPEKKKHRFCNIRMLQLDKA